MLRCYSTNLGRVAYIAMTKLSDLNELCLSDWIDLKKLYTFFNKYGVISAEVDDQGDNVDFTITLKNNNVCKFSKLNYYDSESFRPMLKWIAEN